jgi:hypothetical protein
MKFTNTSTNTHMTRVYRNRDKLLTCALCVLLALPGLAAAKKPTKSNSSNNTTEGCAVLLPAYIETGNSFSVKVVRVPSYPGSWHQPTIYTDVVYPMSPDSSNTDSNTQTINRFNVTYALATFTVPMMETGILTTSTSLDNTATATVTVLISEPLKNGRTKQTKCFSTTPVVQGK